MIVTNINWLVFCMRPDAAQLLNVPVFVILGFVDQIERNLCIALSVFELCLFVVILVFTISFSKKDVQPTKGDERTLLTPGDNE